MDHRRAKSGAISSGTTTELWSPGDDDSGGDLGSGRIAVVGAAQGALAGMAALDSQALPNDAGAGTATATHQCAANGSAPAEDKTSLAAAHLWTYPPRESAEAPHSGENGYLGREDSGLCGNRFGFAFGKFWGGRICPIAESD